MKIRSGFVSNSSTSSFILVGFDWVEDDFDEDADIYDAIDGVGLEYLGEEELAGKYIAHWEYEENESVSLKDIQEKIDEVKVAMKKLGFEKEIKIHYGTKQD